MSEDMRRRWRSGIVVDVCGAGSLRSLGQVCRIMRRIRSQWDMWHNGTREQKMRSKDMGQMTNEKVRDYEARSMRRCVERRNEEEPVLSKKVAA